MTSINLVSPVGNGHTYSVRFREPLVIEPNSKVYLNFAKFKRNSSIYFSTDQTIEIILTEVLPTILPSATTTSNLVMGTNTITIPAINPLTGQTGYTPKQLEQTIADLLGGNPESVSDFGIRCVGGVPKQMYLYNAVYEQQKANQMTIGWFKDFEMLELSSWTGLHATHNKGFGTTGGVAAIKTSADAAEPYYDSYALSKASYDFSFQSNLDVATESQNVVVFRCNKTIDEQVGNVFLGLSSQEIADSVQGTDWTQYADAASKNSFSHHTVPNKATGDGTSVYNPMIYFNGTNDCIPAATTGSTLAAAVPQAFIGVEITGNVDAVEGNKKMLNIWRGTNFANNRYNSLASPKSAINRMKKVYSISLDTLLDGAAANQTQLQLAFQTYWAEGFGAKTRDRLEFRLFNLTNVNVISNANKIFDSKNSFRFVTYNFFKQFNQTPPLAPTVGTDAQKAQKANSQVPFNLIMSAQRNGEGFEEIKMDGFDKDMTVPNGNPANNANPITLVQGYQFKISSELARFVGVNQTESYNPNLPETEVAKITKEDADQHTDESYSVFLKNLPIRAYKNIQSKSMSAGNNVQSAGYAQPIIHDVPSPYSDSKVINSGSGDIVVGTFQPSIIKKLDLDNNKMILNSLDVEIRDIESNEISEGLSGSVINFTIEKP